MRGKLHHERQTKIAGFALAVALAIFGLVVMFVWKADVNVPDCLAAGHANCAQGQKGK